MGALHTAAAYVVLLLGVAGPVVGIVYALRIDRRDFWRRPMLVTGTLTFLAIVGAYISGHRLVSDHPGLITDPGVAPHLEYADRLLLPGAGFFVLVVLTGVLHPRTGVLRMVLPMLLTGFAAVVLVLVVLSGDSGARHLFDTMVEAF